MRIPDNYDMWKAHDAKMEGLLKGLPLCDICGEHIQDEFYYEIDGTKICESCLNDSYKKELKLSRRH